MNSNFNTQFLSPDLKYNSSSKFLKHLSDFDLEKSTWRINYTEKENWFRIDYLGFEINFNFLWPSWLELSYDNSWLKSVFWIAFNFDKNPFSINHIFVSSQETGEVFLAYFEEKFDKNIFEWTINSKVQKIINLSENFDFDNNSFIKLENFINELFKETDFINFYTNWYKRQKEKETI